MIAAARLPDGSRPVLTGEVDFVKDAAAVTTSILYGLLPLGNSTRPNYDDRGLLTHIDIKITSLDFIGTKAKQPRLAHAGHPAEEGHPAIPAMYDDGSPRVFEATLAHELGQSARILRHQTFPDFLVEERLVSNLENQYRYARGIAQRRFYGDVALKQYP